MKYLLTLLIAVVVMSSCSTTSTRRAVDVITNIPTVVEVPNSKFYKKGDTVWVSTITNRVTDYTHFKYNTDIYRKFVLE